MTVNLEDDFVADEIVNLTIDGKVFEYKPTNGGDEINWLNEYMIVRKDEITNKDIVTRDFSMLNKLKLRNIVGVPYTREMILKITGIDKEFKTMNSDQRWLLLSKLKSSVLNKLIDAMTNYDSGELKIKKN